MARPGVKPKPTKLNALHGNPGRRKANAREPVPSGDLNEPPTWFSPEQRAGWDYAIKHAPPGLLRPLDRSALVAWVVAEDLHRQACIMQQHVGLLTRVGRPPPRDADGNPLEPDERPLQQSPFLPIVNKQANIMLKAAAELGFTPSSRSRVIGGPEASSPLNLPMSAEQQEERPASLDDFLANPPPIPTLH